MKTNKFIIFVLLVLPILVCGCRQDMSKIVGHYEGECVLGGDSRATYLDIYPDNDQNPTYIPGLLNISGLQSFEVDVKMSFGVIELSGSLYDNTGNFNNAINLKIKGDTLTGKFPMRIEASRFGDKPTDTECDVKLTRVR
jgi:hypothetical protein